MSTLGKRNLRNGLLAGLAAATVAVPAAAITAYPVKVRTTIDIEAPPDRVYAILADLAGYAAWNPYHVAVEGALSPGAKLVVHIRRPDGKAVTVRPHLLRLVPGRELTWGGGIPGLFYGAHVFRLEALAGGGTRLIHNEDFTGFAVRFANLPADVLTAGYAAMNAALKARAEGEART